MPSFAKSAYQYTTLQKRYDADGTVWIQVQAHGDLTALTPYKVIVNEYGYVTADLASDTNRYYVGVPDKAVSSGDIAWVQIGGYVEGMVTTSLSVAVGHSLSMTTGAVADDAADMDGDAKEFAVCAAESSSSTTQDVVLIPEMITGAES